MKVSVFHHQHPLTTPLIVGAHVLPQREYYRYEIELAAQIYRVELSPLAGLSKESLNEAHAQFMNCLKTLAAQEKIESPEKLFPSVALSWSWFQLLIEQKYFPTIIVKNNLLLGRPSAVNVDAVLELLARNPTSSVLKFKLRSDENFNADYEALTKLAQVLPENIQWRGDGNQMLKQKDLGELWNSPFQNRWQYFEEPVDLMNESLQLKIPLAMDESLVQLFDLYRGDLAKFFEQLSIKIKKLDLMALVLKPTLFGDLFTINKIIEFCLQKGVTLTLSSCYEGALGLATISCPLSQYPHLQHEHHGLEKLKDDGKSYLVGEFFF